MPSTSLATKLEISGLGKQNMTALAAKAKNLGLSPAAYVKQLVEADLAIERDDRSMTLAKIMAPVRKEFRESGMTDDDLDGIVSAARVRPRKSVPALPAADAEGNRPALAFAEASIARNIVRDRESVGLSQKELAKAAGMRVEVLNRAERGMVVPSVRTLIKIEGALVKAGVKRKKWK